jgi:DNA ligase D-like protein (predicted ligase)
MLGILADAPFSSPDYSYELKWDGYRAIAYLDPKRECRLQSRSLKPLSAKFPSLGNLHRQVEKQLIADGEIVSFVNGKPDFSALAKAEGVIAYVAFDLLWLEGESLLDLPLWRRQKQLQKVGAGLNLSLPLATDGLSAFAQAEQLGLEGIMAKAKESLYVPGLRTSSWQKFKVRRKATVVLGGYLWKKELSVLAGAWQGGELKYLGRVGSGFSQQEKGKLVGVLARHRQPACPFRPPLRDKDVFWLTPVLTGDIQYLEVTESGKLRHASWSGLGEKASADCRWEEFARGLPD